MAVTSNGNKESLRKKYLDLRKTITYKQIEESSIEICNSLLAHFNFSHHQIHLFYPIEGKNEINTWPIHQKLIKKNVLHTSIYDHLKNEWNCVHFDHKTTFVKQKFDVPIPKKFEYSNWQNIDVILMPLLCFDKFGNRIGYGKGIYDRICSKLKKSCIKIGLSYFEAHPYEIETDEFDIPLDFCLTPIKLYKFNF